MRLYSRMNAGAVDDPEFGHFEADPDHGGFDLPDELSDRLHASHHRGKRAWETEMERDERLHGEESARRRDPETLYNAVADIAGLGRQIAGLKGGSPEAAAEVTELRKQVAALNDRLAAMEDPSAAGEEDGDPAKSSRSRRTSPAAKTAAAK